MNPPNPAPIDMRHTKLTRQEAALISGELIKPAWASKNEGIHERISFEDTLWGFEMAGGAFYKTPLRVTYVRPDSRAEKACIRMGDTVLRISGQDTATLTLQEAHQLVLEAGINLKIVVTSPEDEINAQYDYQDPLAVNQGLTAEQLKAMEMERVRKALENASRTRQMPWPWVRRKWIIYTESNCFMVPSKYENKHREKYPELPAQKIDYFFPIQNTNQEKNTTNVKDNANNVKENEASTKLEDENNNKELKEGDEKEKKLQNEEQNKETLEGEHIEKLDDVIDQKDFPVEENTENSVSNLEQKKQNSNLQNVVEEVQLKSSEGSVSNNEEDNNTDDVQKNKDLNNEVSEDIEENSDDRIINEIEQNLSGILEDTENVLKSDEDIIDSVLNDIVDSKDSQNERVEQNSSGIQEYVENVLKSEDIIDSVLNDIVDSKNSQNERIEQNSSEILEDVENVPKSDEDIIDSVLNDIVDSKDSQSEKIEQNSSGILEDVENVPKSDEDIIDSVLNDIVDSKDSQNER